MVEGLCFLCSENKGADQLICTFVFAYAKSRFSHDLAHFTEEIGDVEIQDEQPSSHRLAKSMGVDARNMQVMKASFFTEDDAPSGLGM